MSSSDHGPDLMLAYDFPPIGGGIARTLAEVCRRYPNPGIIVSTGAVPRAIDHDVHFPRRIDRVSTPAARLRTLPGLVAWRRRAESLAARVRAGFLWCGNVRPAGWPTRVVARRLRLPYGVLVYGADLVALEQKASRSSLKRAGARRDLGQADAIVAISRWTGEQTARLLGLLDLADAASRIRVVPLGSDPVRFHPGVDSALARARLELPDGRWLLTVARLVPHKGIDTAIEALAALAPGTPSLRYAVAGDGPDRFRLNALAERLGVADRVHWLGAVPDDLLPSLYAAAEIYVGLSREQGLGAEGFGIALADAAASGRPVVAGRSGGTEEVVLQDETGFRVDPASAADAAAAIAALLADRGRACAMGAAGRRLVETHLNWDRVARDVAELSRRGRARPGRS